MKNQKGQGLIEYLIIVALIAVSSLAIMRVLGQNITAKFGDITYALQGSTSQVRKEAINNDHTRIRDMGDFLNGAASRR